jgi:hypothetical protein
LVTVVEDCGDVDGDVVLGLVVVVPVVDVVLSPDILVCLNKSIL